MTFIKKYINKFILLAITAVFPIISFAQVTIIPCGKPGATTSGVICNPISATSLNGLIKTILEGIIKIGIPIIALAIVYCGFLFVSARGNAKELETAKRSLLYTLIGSAILLGSWAIAQVISETVLAL